MRTYEEFADRLRKEVSEAALRGEPRWVEARAQTHFREGHLRMGGGHGLRWMLAAVGAAAAVAAAAIKVYDAWDDRRLASEENRLLVDALFERGFFETPFEAALLSGGAGPVADPWGEPQPGPAELEGSDWFEPAGLLHSLQLE